MFLSPWIQSNRGTSLKERQIIKIKETTKLEEKCVAHLGTRRENITKGLQEMFSGIGFTKGTACYLLLREIKAFIKDRLVFFISVLLDCVWETVLLSVTESWLMGPIIPSVTDYMVC